MNWPYIISPLIYWNTVYHVNLRTFSASNRKNFRTFGISSKIRRSYKRVQLSFQENYIIDNSFKALHDKLSACCADWQGKLSWNSLNLNSCGKITCVVKITRQRILTIILRQCQTLQHRARDDASGPAKAFRSAYEKTNLTVWCTNKLFIAALEPNLNVQSDSISAKVFSSFVFTVLYFCFVRFL